MFNCTKQQKDGQKMRRRGIYIDIYVLLLEVLHYLVVYKVSLLPLILIKLLCMYEKEIYSRCVVAVPWVSYGLVFWLACRGGHYGKGIVVFLVIWDGYVVQIQRWKELAVQFLANCKCWRGVSRCGWVSCCCYNGAKIVKSYYHKIEVVKLSVAVFSLSTLFCWSVQLFPFR
jgi:hypothetical protein